MSPDEVKYAMHVEACGAQAPRRAPTPIRVRTYAELDVDDGPHEAVSGLMLVSAGVFMTVIFVQSSESIYQSISADFMRVQAEYNSHGGWWPFALFWVYFLAGFVVIPVRFLYRFVLSGVDTGLTYIRWSSASLFVVLTAARIWSAWYGASRVASEKRWTQVNSQMQADLLGELAGIEQEIVQSIVHLQRNVLARTFARPYYFRMGELLQELHETAEEMEGVVLKARQSIGNLSDVAKHQESLDKYEIDSTLDLMNRSRSVVGPGRLPETRSGAFRRNLVAEQERLVAEIEGRIHEFNRKLRRLRGFRRGRAFRALWLSVCRFPDVPELPTDIPLSHIENLWD